MNIILQNKRKNMGYTQEKMTNLLGYNSKSTYSDIENAKIIPPVTTALIIAQILHSTVEDLFSHAYQVNKTRT